MSDKVGDAVAAQVDEGAALEWTQIKETFMAMLDS